MEKTILLGASRRIITPNAGGLIAGYKPDLRSESINDDLTVSVFYFKDGDTAALIASATVCAIGNELCHALRLEISERYDIPYEAVVLHSTHTHSGPNLMSFAGWGNADTAYIDEIFRPRLMEAVSEATSRTEPVTMAIARGESLVGVNRREITPKNHVNLGQNPWGPFDPRMTVISFKNAEGERVANFVHYGAHATASGMNKEVTRDWPGPMIDALDQYLGGITAFFNGPEGDVGPRHISGKTSGGLLNGKPENNVKCALQLGAVAAQDAMRIAGNMSGYSPVSLTVSSCEIKVPVKKRISKEEALALYEENKQYTANLPALKKNYAKDVIESYENGYEEIASRPFTQTAIRLGDVVFLTFPFEIFSEIGMRIARASKIPYTLSLAISNGIDGYFPTENELHRGEYAGYEVESFKVRHIQPYADNADFTLVKESLRHIDSLGYDNSPEPAFEFDENATK